MAALPLFRPLDGALAPPAGLARVDVDPVEDQQRRAAHEHGNDDVEGNIPVLLISIKRARLPEARRVVVLVDEVDGRLRRGDRRV